MSIECPECGEDDRIKGTRRTDAIDIVCEVCGHTWVRDLRKRCGYCGSENLRSTPIPIFSKGRGTMQTPSGEREAYACYDCRGDDVTRPKR